MSQSNTQQGTIVLEADINLRGLEGLLVNIVNQDGKARFTRLQTAVPTHVFVLVDGDEAGKPVAAMPLSPDRSVRIKLSGPCEPGDVLVTSGPGGDGGKVNKLPTSAGTYRVIGIAEESGVRDQLVKVRPGYLPSITVTP